MNQHLVTRSTMLTSLADELVLRILTFVGARGVATVVRLLCRHLNSLSHDTHLWLELRSPLSQPPPTGRSQEFMYMIEHCDKETFRTIRSMQIDKDIYRGEVNALGKPDGWGFLHRPATIRCVVGEFRNGKLHGTAVFRFDNNEIYLGSWAEGNKSGWGEYRWHDDCYIGEWLADDEHGHGTYRWGTGDIYQGSWKAGHKSGYGVHVWGKGSWQGDTYAGYWIADNQQGFGEYKWNDGRVYAGNWLHHQRDGLGMYVFDDDTKYIGEWSGGMRHGSGMLITRRMTVSCSWVRDVPSEEVLRTNTYHMFFTLTKERQRERMAEIKQKKYN